MLILSFSALQALGILVQLEGTRFGRRVGSTLPLLAASLHKGVQAAEEEQADARGEDESVVAGWQEVYACLLLLERMASSVPAQVSV